MTRQGGASSRRPRALLAHRRGSLHTQCWSRLRFAATPLDAEEREPLRDGMPASPQGGSDDGWREELRRSGHVLLLSVISYVLLSGAHTHLLSLVMLDVTRGLGLSIFQISLAMGVGNAIKAVLIIVAAGPAMDKFGAETCATWTIAAVVVLGALLAMAPDGAVFAVTLTALVASTAFAEQPCFVCLNATHFVELLSFATSSVASAFSVAGVVLPLALSPLLVAHGWRAVLWALAACSAIALPPVHRYLMPGAIAVGGMRRRVVVQPTHAQGSAAGKAGGAGYASDTGGNAADDLPAGVPAAEALRTGAFWALYAAVGLHLMYGSFLSGHLTTVLRTGCGLDVVLASAINAVQFSCAIVGKLASGALLSLRSEQAQLAVRFVLFVASPLAYCASHLLLLRVDTAALLGGDALGALSFATSPLRLTVYAVTVGLPFGLIFGTLQCLPARLFGRRDLPRLQSTTYSSLLLSISLFLPLVGFLRDAFDGYHVPLLCTFGASVMLLGLLLYLRAADERAVPPTPHRAARRRNYAGLPEVV